MNDEQMKRVAQALARISQKGQHPITEDEVVGMLERCMAALGSDGKRLAQVASEGE